MLILHCLGVYTSYLADVYPVLLVLGGHSERDVVVHCIGDYYQEVSKITKPTLFYNIIP